MSNLAFLGTQIPTTWIEATIGDVTSKVGSGATPRGGASVYVEDGVALIRSQNVHDHEFRPSGLAYISDDAAHALRGVTVAADDVMLNITGDSILRTCLAPNNVGPARVNQHVAIIRSNGRVDPVFLQKWLSLPAMKDYMLGHSSGGTRKAITKGHILDFPIPLPPIEEQRSIASTLGALDDKIASNKRVIGLVPQLIRSRVDACLAEGAKEAPVSSLARFVNGGAYTNGATGSGRMVIRIAELNSGPGGSTVYNELDVPVEKTAHAGDVLMSWSGSLGVYRWARDEAIINQHIFKVIPTGYPAWFVFDRLDAVIDVFRGYAADKATTMGHIKRGDLDTTTVQLPREDTLRELSAGLGPLWERLLIAEREVLRLEALRDAILPELLSGRMRVREAQGAKA